MKSTLVTLVTTNAGWITRLALKYVAIGGASLSAWLAAQGVAESHTAAIASGVTAGAAALIEQGLSFIARKYAVK
jgi:hypothetical protein